jgi:hypothetical protein
MSVLSAAIAPLDAPAIAATVAAAAATDWKAAAWLLQHHPLHRQTWGDAEATRRAVSQALAVVVDVIEHADHLHPEQRRLLLLQLAGRGIAAPPELPPEV